MKTKCPICRGAKKMMKLGYVEGDCCGCDGKGHIIIKQAESTIGEIISKTAEDKIHTTESIKHDDKMAKRKS